MRRSWPNGTDAQGWYEAVFNGAPTLGPALVGLVAFSSASVVMAWALRGGARVPLWVALIYGLSAPLIGLLGVAVGVLQTAGSIGLLVSGVALAIRLRRERNEMTLHRTRPEAQPSGP